MTRNEPWKYSLMPSPVGELLLALAPEGLAAIRFSSEGRRARPEEAWRRDDEALAPYRLELEEYFAGRRREFSLKLAPRGTSFQLAVWRALQQIPYGRTASYGELARRVGRAQAARAVGAANGSNPLPIVLPCHRVIGKDGSLTGYGGGIAIKEKLLALEGVRLAAG